MKNFENIQLLTLANTLVSLLSAFVLGSIVGFERQFRQRTAGLRTNALVAVGAAIFVDMAFRVGGADGGARVISYVVSGVGFLGAGAIMRGRQHPRAEHCSHAVGLGRHRRLRGRVAAARSGGRHGLRAAANTLLRPLVSHINRQPVDAQTTEVTTVIHVIAHVDERQAAMTVLEDVLEAEQLPLSELKIDQFGENEVEIEAALSEAAVDEEDLDRVAARIASAPAVRTAFWAARTV